MVAAAAGAVWWSYHYSEARRHWNQAQLALKDENPELAREHLAQCLRCWWNDRGDVRFLAAKAARRAGLLDEAEEHLSACENLPAGSVSRESLR